jgi:hypothetical protein
MPRKRIIKMTAVAGIVGPILFATALLSLTALQYDFMVGIGWQPWRDPAGAWPSGLALGPYGWAQNASFIVSGVLLMIFATGLHLGVTGGLGSQAGPGLWHGDGAHGLRDRPDKAHRPADAARPRPRPGLRALRPHLASRPFLPVEEAEK